jgi:uncharacterized protein YbjT (DUF2867 family)
MRVILFGATGMVGQGVLRESRDINEAARESTQLASPATDP